MSGDQRIRALQDKQAEKPWLGLGPKGAEPSVWDIDTQQQVYAARAPKGNRMTPQESPWATAIAAVPGQVLMHMTITVPCREPHWDRLHPTAAAPKTALSKCLRPWWH